MNKTTVIKTAGFVGLFAITALGVVLYPWLTSVQAKQININDPVHQISQHPNERPQVEVVFVLDTTGSMGGLIETAKEKIWSIASSMASAENAPDIKIGLVAYRDRGDVYVTKVTNLSSDLDSIYATLMDYQAQGGGDGPESVNQALFDAVNQISWSRKKNVYRSIFLVGDAPPHMDYSDDVKYPQTLAIAKSKNIVINTIQCGAAMDTQQQWQQIAQLSQGQFFNVAQSGGGINIATPYDNQIAALARELEDTKLYFGSEEDRKEQQRKLAAVDKVLKQASAPSLARRAEFNASASGAKNFAGEKDLVEEVVVGNRLKLKDIPAEQLPASVAAIRPEKREDFVKQKARQRADLNQQIRNLSKKRQAFIATEIEKKGDSESSLDEQIYSVIKEQGEKAGLDYKEDSAVY